MITVRSLLLHNLMKLGELQLFAQGTFVGVSYENRSHEKPIFNNMFDLHCICEDLRKLHAQNPRHGDIANRETSKASPQQHEDHTNCSHP